MHHTHEALIQAGEIEGYRDAHKTFNRDFNYPVHGSDFGVHQHWGYDLPHDDMGNSSAGCLVGCLTQGHREFMSIVLKDPRYKENPTYHFMTAIYRLATFSQIPKSGQSALSSDVYPRPTILQITELLKVVGGHCIPP